MTQETRVTAFVIDRATWLRGEGYQSSALLRSSDGKRCGVGIYLRACGVPDKRLKNVDEAESVAGLPKQADWLITAKRNSDLAMKLYGENDGTAKESAIATLFAEMGITVTFTGKPR